MQTGHYEYSDEISHCAIYGRIELFWSSYLLFANLKMFISLYIYYFVFSQPSNPGVFEGLRRVGRQKNDFLSSKI
jgi:hypothetical protein